ncbi:aminotransferase class IV [Aquirufa aurantiipilula]|uniref:Aminotransferase class IV n=1 Tax=Aquirufa aurantiipilula TaxID=2696561 RepID=A0ABT6BHI7_9BACT|nr:aminotransferase class IV [Aquirufa aurantiipilula]MDF5689927.1 aminotransferase class IV [Aquirufa aurantiipilula]
MPTFLETVHVLDGELLHLDYHQKRINDVFQNFYPTSPILNIYDYLAHVEIPQQGSFRARLVYSTQWEFHEFIAYQEKNIKRLAIVNTGDYEYQYKYADRSHLLKKVAEHPEADDIIFSKQGKLQDSSIANLAFKKGDKWFTPKEPLHWGTTRRRLIDEKILEEIDIWETELSDYSHICLINVFRPLSDHHALLLPDAIV